MIKKLLFTGLVAFAFSGMRAQINYSEVAFWVGSGTDTTLMVIDFQDGSYDSSYVWGYAYNHPATGEQMLNAIAAADINLTINIDTLSFGNFLQDASYHRHQGLGGNPDFWGTWTSNTLELDSMTANMGIGDTLVPGGMFGFSYMDFNPSVAPGQPWAAYNPTAFTFADVQTWFGSGTDSAAVIIDFNNGTDTASFVWGFRFNDSIDALALVDSIAAHDANLSINAGGAFNGITYKNLSDGPSALNDWYAWTATNWGNWDLHYSTSTSLKNGDMLALVHTKMLQLQRPHLPQGIAGPIGLEESMTAKFSFYPNPAQSTVYFEGAFDFVNLYNSAGQLIDQTSSKSLIVSDLSSGIYYLQFQAQGKSLPAQKLIIQ